jgi:arylformamidase
LILSKSLVDLTQPFFNGMLYNWYIPGVPRPELSTIVESDEKNHVLGFQKLVTATHIGTHIDAQRHVVGGGVSIDQYELNRFFGPAVCWDISYKGKLGVVTSADLERCEPRLQGERMILLHTGYGRHFETDYHTYYEQPYLSLEAADWLIEHKVELVGIDGHTVDKPYSIRSTAFVPNVPVERRSISPAGPESESVHERLMKKNILIVEHMANLDKVMGKRFTLCTLPLKLRGGDGSPARCIAILDE